MKAKLIILLISFFCCTFVFSQADRNYVRKGNKDYEKERYAEAELNYREALGKNSRSVEAVFNLGNALQKQGKHENARNQFQIAATNENPQIAASAYHNIGNSFMEEKNYAQSVEAYKQALRLNPDDNETRYNLAVANALLKQQQNEQNEGGGDNDDEKKEDKQESPDQQNKQPQPNEPNQQDISDDNMQQILDAFAEEEKQLMEKIEKQQNKSDTRKPDKDW